MQNNESKVPLIDCSAILQLRLEQTVKDILKIISEGKDEQSNIKLLPTLAEAQSKRKEHENKVEDERRVTIRFRSDHPGVVLCDVLKEVKKNNKGLLMDIILDNFFWNLQVHDDYFSVMLLFGSSKNGVRQVVQVPYSAITHFFYGKFFDISMLPHYKE